MPRRSFQTLMKRGSNGDIRDSGEASRARLRKREIDGAGLFRKCGGEDIPRRREDIAAAPPFD